MKISKTICLLVIAMTAQALTVGLGSGIASAQDKDKEHQDRLRDDVRHEQWRKSFDFDAYIKSQDKNKDGVLSPEEMDGRRTRDFLGKIGVNTKKSSKIDVLIKNYKDRKTKKAEKKNKEFQDRLRTLASFGTEEKSHGVGKFGVKSKSDGLRTFGEAASGMKPSDFSPELVKKADKIFETFDRDKSGFLDGSEIATPPPEDSDLNRDGRLSRLELAKRFADYEDTKKPQSSSQDSTKSTSSSSGSKKLDAYHERHKDRFGSRDGHHSENRTNSRVGNATGASPGRSKSYSGSNNYGKYVDRLYKKYDSNSDGKLDKKELSASTLLKKAQDSDGDGMISKQEAIALVSGGRRSTSNPQNLTNLKATSSDGPYNSGSKTSNQRSSLTNIDANGDGQIQMHEFSDTWTAEKLKEFRDKDKNGDGLLSPTEWKSKTR